MLTVRLGSKSLQLLQACGAVSRRPQVDYSDVPCLPQRQKPALEWYMALSGWFISMLVSTGSLPTET
eukprot:4974141-Amphidinium_carterae.1